MQAKQKFIVMLAVLAVLFFAGLGIILYFYFQDQDTAGKPSNKNINTVIKQNVNQTIANTNQTTTQTNANPVTNQATVSQNGEDTVISTAKNFASRFGTFSSQSNYENLESLETYMSAEMKSWAEEYVANSKKQQSNEPYSSITTTATGTSILEYDEANGFAKVQVETMRTEKKQIPPSEKKYQQKINISFIKENGAWKVGAADWL